MDHVVVSTYGIFVIETKNYKGWITGSENSNQRVKNMYGKKYPFRNPIKQTYGHVKALENMLGFSYETFIPIVVFSVQSDLKVKTKSPVVYTTQLTKTIRKYAYIKIQKEEKIVKAGICLKCGSELIERKGKNGTFVGFSNYPKCRYTKG